MKVTGLYLDFVKLGFVGSGSFKVIYGSMTQGLSMTILRKNNSGSMNINFRLNPNAHINSYVINVYKHSQSTMKERHTWD